MRSEPPISSANRPGTGELDRLSSWASSPSFTRLPFTFVWKKLRRSESSGLAPSLSVGPGPSPVADGAGTSCRTRSDIESWPRSTGDHLHRSPRMCKPPSPGSMSLPLLSNRATNLHQHQMEENREHKPNLGLTPRVDLSEQPNNLSASLRIYRQQVDDVGPVVPSFVAVAEQVRGDRVAVGLVVDQDAAEVFAGRCAKGAKQVAEVVV